MRDSSLLELPLLNSYFSEQLLFRIVIFHNSYLTYILKQLVSREVIFQNSLSDIFISNFYFTFVLLNTFISLKIFTFI